MSKPLEPSGELLGCGTQHQAFKDALCVITPQETLEMFWGLASWGGRLWGGRQGQGAGSSQPRMLGETLALANANAAVFAAHTQQMARGCETIPGLLPDPHSSLSHRCGAYVPGTRAGQPGSRTSVKVAFAEFVEVDHDVNTVWPAS